MSSLEEARTVAAHLQDVVEIRQLDKTNDGVAWAADLLVRIVLQEGVTIENILTAAIWSVFAAHPELIHSIHRIDPTIDLSCFEWVTVIQLLRALEIRIDERSVTTA